MPNLFFRAVLLVWMLALAGFAQLNGRAQDVPHYANGSLINLATIRGTQATASANLQPAVPASFMLHMAEGEIRYGAHYGPAWWMMELPGVYKVAHVRVQFRNVIESIAFTIKVATEAPADWSTVPATATFKGPLSNQFNGQGVVTLNFPAVDAKFVRLEVKGFNGGENFSAGKGHEDLVISNLAAWGPNDPAINPAISSAQATWAGGQATVQDVLGIRDASAVIDDNDPDNGNGQVYSFDFEAPGSPAPGTAQVTAPASFVITLAHRTMVQAVSYSAITDSRTEKPRDAAIYTSPTATGNDWTRQKEVKDVQSGIYEEIALDQPVRAQRVRLDVERVYNPQVDPNLKAAHGRLAEIYVFGTALPDDVSLNVATAAQLSMEITDAKGAAVRVVAPPHEVQPGTVQLNWDGNNDEGQPMPAGEYNLKVMENPATYTTMPNLGNTALPGTPQNPSCVRSLACDAAGNIYSADVWEEAGQDFRKWDRDTGHYVYDDHAEIRNGNPNALPYAIAVDEKYVYCATDSHGNHHQQHIRRFNLADGSPAPFPTRGSTGGHILLHENPGQETPPGTPADQATIMWDPINALVSVGGKLYATDALAGKVWIFDRETGVSLGNVSISLPTALAVDSLGQLWVAYDKGNVAVCSPNGGDAAQPITGLKNIQAMAFGPNHTLYVADAGANQVQIYTVNEQQRTATPLRTFGGPAKAGDSAPDKFFALTGLTVDKDGAITVAQNLPVNGARVSRFMADGKLSWDQLGAEFCSSGNYAQKDPDMVVSQYLHAYHVNKQTGQWEYRGALLDGNPSYINWQHGATRMLELNGTDFFFSGYGDSLQVYRKVGGVYRLCAAFGSANPMPNGVDRDNLPGPDDKKPPRGIWSWHDTNGNGKVDDDEINWLVKPGGPNVWWWTMGINTDNKGNAYLCDQTGNVLEVPLTGFDAKGNPIYDLTRMQTLVKEDASPSAVACENLMVLRADDGTLYVDSRSKVFPKPPESNGGWMAGWVLSRYDKDGKRLWTVPLPHACPGMDYIPGGGVMLITIVWGPDGSEIYHYDANGMLIGITSPDPKWRGFGGIPDNTGSMCVSRDPRDGIIDLFFEDCVGNRFHWMRVDDRKKPHVRTIHLKLTKPGDPVQRID